MNNLPSLLNFDIKPPPQKDEIANVVVEEVSEETGEENPNFVYEETITETEELQETIDLDFVKKPDILEDEIFASSRKAKRKVGKPTRSTSPKKVKRKPLSEEDKAKRREALARGRATRARNLAKKKELEAEAQHLANEEKELQLENKQLDLEMQNAQLNKKAKKVKQVMIEDSSDEEEIQYVKKSKKKVVRSPTPARSSITAEDIERSQLNTLMAYEKMRKDRKAEKKRVAQIEAQQQQIKQTMNQVNNAWGRGAGKYSNMLQNMGL